MRDGASTDRSPVVINDRKHVDPGDECQRTKREPDHVTLAGAVVGTRMSVTA